MRVEGVPLVGLLEEYDRQCALSNEIVAAHSLDDVGTHPEETARHVGHLDAIREILDGQKGYYLHRSGRQQSFRCLSHPPRGTAVTTSARAARVAALRSVVLDLGVGAEKAEFVALGIGEDHPSGARAVLAAMVGDLTRPPDKQRIELLVAGTGAGAGRGGPGS